MAWWNAAASELWYPNLLHLRPADCIPRRMEHFAKKMPALKDRVWQSGRLVHKLSVISHSSLPGLVSQLMQFVSVTTLLIKKRRYQTPGLDDWEWIGQMVCCKDEPTDLPIHLPYCPENIQKRIWVILQSNGAKKKWRSSGRTLGRVTKRER